MGAASFIAASRLQHASRNMRHAKIKSGFTTEDTEFTEEKKASFSVCSVNSVVKLLLTLMFFATRSSSLATHS